ALAAKKAELPAAFGAEADKKCRQAVIIILAPFFPRMMVALGALHSDSQEKLRGGLRPVRGTVAHAIEVCRSDREGASLGRDDVSDKFIHRPVFPKLGPNPVVKTPHPFFIQLSPIDA